MQASGKISRWALFFMLLFIFVPQFSLDLYLPALPMMKHAFGTTASKVQLTIAVYLVAIAASQFFYGPLSDSYGRRPIVIFGCLFFVIGSAICSLAGSIDALLFGRLVQGLGLGFGSMMSRTILRDLVHDKKLIAKIISMQSMAWATTPLFAPVMGGYISHYLSWRLNFWLLFFFGLLMLGLAFFKLEETRLAAYRKRFNIWHLLKNYWFIIRHFNVVGYMLIIALQYGAVMTILQFSPFIFQVDLGYSASTYGWLILLVGVSSVIGSRANKTLSQHFNLKKIIMLSMSFALLMACLMNVLAIHWFNAWVVLIPIFLIRLSGGTTYSNCITEGISQHPEHAGSISALFGVVITSGGAIISALVARIPQTAQWTLSGSLLVEYLLAMLIFLVLYFKYQ